MINEVWHTGLFIEKTVCHRDFCLPSEMSGEMHNTTCVHSKKNRAELGEWKDGHRIYSGLRRDRDHKIAIFHGDA